MRSLPSTKIRGLQESGAFYENSLIPSLSPFLSFFILKKKYKKKI